MPMISYVARTAPCLVAALMLAGPRAPALARDLPLMSESAADPTVLAPIQELDQALIEIMKAGKGTAFQTRMQMLTPVVTRVFDLPHILRVSVGSSWSKLTPDQQTALLGVFRNYTVASYVENFDSYDGQKFVVNPATRSLGAGQQVVSTEIVPQSGTAHKLDYVMRKTDAGWKVSDVLADGSISRVAVQRSDFSALLSRGGAPALEASLQQKTQTLSRS